MLPLVLMVLVLIDGAAASPTVVATGFAWAENILCEPAESAARNGTLWVSESTRGELWRVTWRENEGAAGQGDWEQTLHYSRGADRVAGLARDPGPGGGLYALVQPEDAAPGKDGKNCVLMRIDRNRTDAAEAIATLPRKCLGDGLAFDNATQTFFVANEGDFLPYNGKVYAIQKSTGAVTEIAQDGGPYTSTDGASYDAATGLLFVSEVYASALLRVNVAKNTVEKIKAPDGVQGIDDFCVSEDDTNLIHATSPLNGKVFRWNMSSDEVRVFGEGLQFPTSVRAGCLGLGMGGWFVTEGGGVEKDDIDRRVLWFPGDASE